MKQDLRFTLTMWDVKFIYLLYRIALAQFYLNYVGCKVKSFFTNNMFNKKFYLNYVGCKGV